MAKSKVTFNESVLEKVAQQAAQQWADNALVDTYQGRPIEEVKAAVAETWRCEGGEGASITDPELTQYAEPIAAGGTIRIEA